ncbi:toluene tolerance protein [Aestuariirhabdus sp. LZHN29]|uniref:toluene tolerance protein n=1 Tax=Aestuariirhabdus sp. LZHN29 TaxID=3417462 RepID=UPI003CFB6F9B
MKTLNSSELSTMTDLSTTLEEDGYGIKVLRLNDGSFLKLFRLKRIFSSALLYPYAKRFADNAKKLESLGIPTVRVIDLFDTIEPRRNCVHYHPLPGITLRELYRSERSPMPHERVALLGKLLANLHDKGVYFRSIHLGNIVLTPDGELGLIDISDMKIQQSPLSTRLRRRNFSHLIKGDDDRNSLHTGGPLGQLLLDSYVKACKRPHKRMTSALAHALGLAQ